MEVHDILRCQFVKENGEKLGDVIDLMTSVDDKALQEICDGVIAEEVKEKFLFFINEKEIKGQIKDYITSIYEPIIYIECRVRTPIRVQPVCRCSNSLEGHEKAIVSVSFSPDGTQLATGSGDTTVRLWDLNTNTPISTLQGHTDWVICLSWSPDGNFLTSACKAGLIIIWRNNEKLGILKGHSKWITSLCWEPLHKSRTPRLASGSKDGTVRIWNIKLRVCIISLSGQTKGITCVRWGGEGFLYSASQDCTIGVWDDVNWQLLHILRSHAHWVTVLALNTDYAMRFPFRKTESTYENILKSCNGKELMASGSDDFTVYVWSSPATKPIFRLCGHQQTVIDLKFSPDGKILASASFDKSLRLWNALTGEVIAVLYGHVNKVYQLAWSADSRYLVSGSADSTIKLWSVKSGKLRVDLPGHADEVYAIDWSPDGYIVASGGKDKILKLWKR